MSDASEDSRLKEPPGDLVRAPVNRVTALMDEPDHLAAAVQELTGMGFNKDDIYVLTGSSGARRLDVTGKHHGLGGRLYRFVEKMAGTGELVERAAQHMEAGGLAVSIPADGEEQAEKIAEILERHGGHEILHHGRFHYDRLRP